MIEYANRCHCDQLEDAFVAGQAKITPILKFGSVLLSEYRVSLQWTSIFLLASSMICLEGGKWL